MFPLVSIVIRTKNRPHSLLRAVSSIIHQTYAHIELIIINDGSCSISDAIALAKKTLSQVQYRSTPLSLGRSASANKGLELVSGAYVGFLDDDDELDKDHIANLIPFLTKSHVCIAYSGIRSQSNMNYNQAYSKFSLAIANYIPIHAVLFSSDFIQQGLRFDEKLLAYEDWDFWLQLSQYDDFHHLDKVTGTYHSMCSLGDAVTIDKLLNKKNKFIIYNKWIQHWSTNELCDIFEGLFQRQTEIGAALDSHIESLQIKDEQIIKLQKNNQLLSMQMKKISDEYEICIQSQQLCMKEKERVYTVLNNEVKLLRSELDKLKSSLYWKLTWPFRVIKKLLFSLNLN